MTVYALKHPDGRWLYHLPTPDSFGTPGFGSRAKVAGVYADGRPMEQLHAGWWATDHEAVRLTTTGQPSPKTTGYRLTDPTAESVRYPATLTVDEWNERSDRESDTLWTLYTNVHEDQPVLEHVYDGPVMVLEGREPPGPDERQWIADLPQMLTQRPEYRHLFPGHIPGLIPHLMAVFEEMPRVDYVYHNFQNEPGVYVSLRVPYDRPRTEWQAYIGRNGKPLKSGRDVPVYVTRRLTLPIPGRVTADTYAQALVRWQEQVDHWTRVVEEASVAACHHCDGHGFVPSGSERYSRSVYPAT